MFRLARAAECAHQPILSNSITPQLTTPLQILIFADIK
jgi:hypothetical protein